MTNTELATELREMAVNRTNNERDLHLILAAAADIVEKIDPKVLGDMMEESSVLRNRVEVLQAKVALMESRVHSGERTDDCPFCATYPATGRSQQIPTCHLCTMESERDTLAAENAKLKGWLETETMNREEFGKLQAENARLRDERNQQERL